ncbi:MAG: hypothetical protein M3O03_08830 [Pseudomonadota bacterium]|nr:hypothetical protein [Pseudomonadota bacterium]
MTKKTIAETPKPEKLGRRKFLGLASAALCAPALAGCTLRSGTFRYRLTLSLNTPDGVKTGSVVNEVTHSEVYGFPDGRVYPSYHRGQALFVDLGPGRKPLIALMVYSCGQQQKCPDLSHNEVMQLANWANFGPTGIFTNNPAFKVDDDYGFIKGVSKWKAMRAHVNLKLQELPDLITFKDINDPLTVELVDPWHLEDKLGAGVRWNAMTVDVLDDSTPVVFDLETKLPWYVKMRDIQKQKHFGIGLDSDDMHWGMESGKLSLANDIRLYNFEHGRD